MAKKPVKKASAAKTKRVSPLKANTSALVRHTKELERNAVALATHTKILHQISARQLVYDILQEPLTLPDTTPLSKLLLDSEALAGTAAAIRARGVNVDTA